MISFMILYDNIDVWGSFSYIQLSYKNQYFLYHRDYPKYMNHNIHKNIPDLLQYPVQYDCAQKIMTYHGARVIRYFIIQIESV